MAAKKFLRNVQGIANEVTGVQTSSGAANAGDIPALNDQGVFDTSLLPTGIGADTSSLVASETLSAGDFVNVWNNSGVSSARKADASVTGKRAHGFVLVNVSSGSNAQVFFEGNNDQVTGVTAGDVFLSATTPGKATNTCPTGSGQIAQILGVAVSTTKINVEIDSPINLA